MKKKTLKDTDLFKRTPSLASKISTGDIALSLEKFIERNYRGRVRFSRQNCNENAITISCEYDFARMIKAVIKELTLERTCMISFSSTEDSFSIGFEAHADSPISDLSIKNLVAEGERLGISVKANSAQVTLTVMAKRLSHTSVYERDTTVFYNILYTVFTE